MSRHWRMVSEAMHKLAVGLHEVKSEGMFPYETYYILATDKELERLCDLGTASIHVADDKTLRSDRGHLLEPV
jgi:hypothetical protein